MAQSDFTLINGVLSATDVLRGVTTGIARPNGGGSFIFGYHSQVATSGAVAFYINDSGGRTKFGPLKNDSNNPTGGSIRMAMKRGSSAGTTTFAPFIYLGPGTASPGAPTATDIAYMLGLSDEDPHRIVLRKGAPANGLSASGSATTGRLAIGSQTYLVDGTSAPQKDGWLHLRLDIIVNPNGDVILSCFQSDLNVSVVTSPSWVAVPGIVDFVDDGLGINSGSLPLIGPGSSGGKFGYAGFGVYSAASGRRVFFDQVEILRQK